MKNLIRSSTLALIAVPAGYAEDAVRWRRMGTASGVTPARVSPLIGDRLTEGAR